MKNKKNSICNRLPIDEMPSLIDLNDQNILIWKKRTNKTFNSRFANKPCHIITGSRGHQYIRIKGHDYMMGHIIDQINKLKGNK